MSPFGAAGSDDADRPRHDWHAEKVKGDSHQIWRTQRVQANVESLRLFLRSSTGPNRAFEPQWLGRARDPVRMAEGPTAIEAATQRRHFGFRLRLVDKLQPIGGGSGRGQADGATNSLLPGKHGWPPMSHIAELYGTMILTPSLGDSHANHCDTADRSRNLDQDHHPGEKRPLPRNRPLAP